ncbi:MAG: tripartite tricarboxylate transporter TctB family protein [Pseudomonadales bacterium]
MALDRWIALVILGICLIYGYTAWFTMDDALAPFMRRNPIWPSTFPKVLSILGIIASMIIVLGLEKAEQKEADTDSLDYRRLTEYNLGQALLLLGLMVVYAVCLRPVGFLISTSVFLIAGAFILGDRKWHVMIPVAVIASFFVWYLVQQVLGIYMRPLPGALSGVFGV